MPDKNLIANHYTRGGLLEAISSGIARLGKTHGSVSIEDLAPVDEFHIGGRVATEDFLDQIAPGNDDHILDVGCGLGGASRFAAQRYGCRVTGVDLTREFVDAGNVLCSWVGLDHQIKLEHGDAAATPFPSGRFDKAYMLHVGMNIADKTALARELHRLLKPGGVLGIYDVMRVGEGELNFPVPWASDAGASAVSSPDEYKKALTSAGFEITAERNRGVFALEFFARLQAAAASAEGPPPLGLHIVMGETAPMKLRNMIQSIKASCVAPVELIARSVA